MYFECSAGFGFIHCMSAAPGAAARSRIQPCVSSLVDCEIAASTASGEPDCMRGRFCAAQPTGVK
jgi:hypothetical protein